MSEPAAAPTLLTTLSLREVRSYLRRSHARGLAVFIAVAYALSSMLLGGMLVLARYSGGYTILVLWGNRLGFQNWNYPGLLIEAPWGFVDLPFFATLSMVLVSVGVGLGMAVAIVLSYRLLRGRKAAAGRPAAAGTIAGLTPAMIALVTLGACCSTTAAATAGVGLVAAATGSSTTNLLLNNWILGVFQIVVVYVALLAQELLLRVYGTLFATNDPGFSEETVFRRSVDRHAIATTALRVGLLAAGVTWALAALADWATVNPFGASAAMWFNWAVEHWLVSGVAILAGLSPRTLERWFAPIAATSVGRAFRGGLLVGAWTLAGWLPAPLAGAGIEGFGNELLGTLGAPAAFGAVAPPFPWGPLLLLRWAFQYLLLAGFAGAVSIAPAGVVAWLASDDPHPSTGPSPESVPAPTTVSLSNAR